MKISKSTILELRELLKQEFNLELDDKTLHKFAYSLLGYFDLLSKVENRHKFRNSSSQGIAPSKDKSFNKNGGK